MKFPVFPLSCLVLGNLLATSPRAQETVQDAAIDPAQADSAIHAHQETVPPSTTFFSTRGMSQTNSAEALGMGRLVFGVTGQWYQQDRGFPGAPPKNADIFTGIGSAALGLNRFMDFFATLSGYGISNWDTSATAGLGVVGAGLHATLPSFRTSPLWLAVEAGVYQGISDNRINRNHADGYNYFETRKDLDFTVKLLQTVAVGPDAQGIRFHANEGVVTTTESGKDPLMLLSAGAQINFLSMVLGFEANSRTFFDDVDFTHDPVWLTPTLQIRTPYNFILTFGGDIATVSTRDDSARTRSLEPYRLFTGIALTFDTQAKKKREAMAKQQQQALAQARLDREADSLAAAKDSLTMKAMQDSLALAEARKKLDEERSRRTTAENQLLSTGTLLLDTVYFRTGSSEISLNSKPYLKMIAEMLIKYPKLELEVAGHTDSKGNDAYNLSLSQSRADAVAAYLIQERPSLKGMVSPKGYGETQPVADNAAETGRKLNRRTELRVLNRLSLQEYNP